MSKRFRGSDVKAEVGIKFDTEGKDILAAAGRLCMATGMTLRAVHVTEHLLTSGASHGDAYYERLLGAKEFQELVTTLSDEDTLRARESLDEMLAALPREVKVERIIIAAKDAVEALVADAKNHHAALLIVGLSEQKRGLFQRDLVTAMNLMAASPLPVLILPHGTTLDRSSYRIFVADDLTPENDEIISCAASLACALKNTELVHAHIIDFTFKDLVERLELRMASSAPEPWSPAELWSLAEQRVRSLLSERAGAEPHLIEAAGGSYQPLVLTGHVADELEGALHHFKPDIVVFGRRHEQRPLFGLGSLSLHTLHSRAYGVLIVPARST